VDRLEVVGGLEWFDGDPDEAWEVCLEGAAATVPATLLGAAG
jgi:hypothetical protein